MMARLRIRAMICSLAAASQGAAAMEVIINEYLEEPSTPGSAWSGTFEVTSTESLWAFGVGSDLIQDVSISGIAEIDGLQAKNHWTSTLISRAAWEIGYDFDSIRPIGATPPSSFFIDTTTVAWQWGDASYVAFYWLSEAGDDPTNPLAVLQPGVSYDAFKFFTDGPGSPFAAFTASDGGDVFVGETIEIIVPAPATGAALLLISGGVLAGRRRES